MANRKGFSLDAPLQSRNYALHLHIQKCKLKVICPAFQKMRLFSVRKLWANSKNMRLCFTITDKQLPILSCNYISDSRKYQENGNI